MTQPSSSRFGKFSGVSYDPDLVIDHEPSPQPSRGDASHESAVVPQPSSTVARPRRGRMQQVNTGHNPSLRTSAVDTAAQLGSQLEAQSRDVGPAGAISEAIGDLAKAASMVPDKRIATVGAVVNRAVQAHDVAVSRGVDIPGKARDYASDVMQRIKSRPRREQGLFTRLTQSFGHRNDSIPIENENVAQYAERMVSHEMNDRVLAVKHSDVDVHTPLQDEDAVSNAASDTTSTDVAVLSTEGMQDFIDHAQQTNIILSSASYGDATHDDPLVVDGEVISETYTDGGGRGGYTGGVGVQSNHPSSKEIAIIDLDKHFMNLDQLHDFEATAGTAAAYAATVQKDAHREQLAIEPAPEGVSDEYAQMVGETISGEDLDRMIHGTDDLTDMEKKMRDVVRTLQTEAARQYANNEAKNNPFSKDNINKPSSENIESMKKNHDRFAGMMVMTAIAPLRHGADADSLAAVAGSLAIMWALSPKFRDYTAPFTEKLLRGSSHNAEEKARNERKGFFFKSVRERNEADKRAENHIKGFVSEKERMQQSDPAHAPYHVDSAAMQLVSVSNNAYDAMREPGASSDTILRKYGVLTEKLEAEWKREGVDVDQVHDRARWIIGNQVVHDPTVVSRYVDTSVGGIVLTNATHNATTGNHEWNGNWCSSANKDVVVGTGSGFFTPRGPQTVEQHFENTRAAMVGCVAPLLNNIQGPQDEKAIAEVISSITVMTNTQNTTGVDVSGRDDSAGRTLGLMQSLRQGMVDDGMSEDYVNEVMRSGFIQMFNDVNGLYTEKMNIVNAAYPMERLADEPKKYATGPDQYLSQYETVRMQQQPDMSTGLYHMASEPEHDDPEKDVRKEADSHHRGGERDQSTPRAYEQKYQQQAAENDGHTSTKRPTRTQRKIFSEPEEFIVGGHGGMERVPTDDELNKESVREDKARQFREHETEMREATAGARPGVTTTPAGMDQIRSFKNDYDQAGRGDIPVNHDDQTTVEQEDEYNRGRNRSAQRSRQALRVQTVQDAIVTEDLEEEARKRQREAKKKSIENDGPELDF